MTICVTEYKLTERDAVVDPRSGRVYPRVDVRELDTTLKVRYATSFQDSRPSGAPS
jgi:hypothetical protein